MMQFHHCLVKGLVVLLAMINRSVRAPLIVDTTKWTLCLVLSYQSKERQYGVCTPSNVKSCLLSRGMFAYSAPRKLFAFGVFACSMLKLWSVYL